MSPVPTAGILAGLVLGGAVRPAVAGWPHFRSHGGYVLVQPAPVQTTLVVPATTIPAGSSAVVPRPVSASNVMLAPTQPVPVAASAPVYYYVPASPVSASPAPVSSGGTPALTAGGVTDYDFQLLSAGFGGSFVKVANFEKALKDRLEQLIAGQGGILNPQTLAPLLGEFAKSFLQTNGFGFLIDAAVEPTLNRLIGKLIQERQQAGGATQPGGAAGPATIPAGGGTFQVTGSFNGTITLTPAGTTQPVSPDQPTQPTPPQPEGIPAELDNEGGQVAPSLP
jgi:hypothetical protein